PHLSDHRRVLGADAKPARHRDAGAGESHTSFKRRVGPSLRRSRTAAADPTANGRHDRGERLWTGGRSPGLSAAFEFDETARAALVCAGAAARGFSSALD